MTFGTQSWLFINKYSSEEIYGADKGSGELQWMDARGVGGVGGSAAGSENSSVEGVCMIIHY